MLVSVAPDLWIAEGPTVSFLGFPYSTRMALVRLGGGDLWVWSPIQVVDDLRHEVDALGPVRHVVSPNKLHHLYMGEWANTWPDARLYGSPGLARKRPDLRFAAELADEPDPAWSRDIDQVIFRSLAMDEVVFFHRPSSTALITDLVQKFDPALLHGWRGCFMKLDGLVGPDGSTPREWRLAFWNRVAARRALRKALDWAPERVIIAHGVWVRENGREVLRRSFAWLGA